MMLSYLFGYFRKISCKNSLTVCSTGYAYNTLLSRYFEKNSYLDDNNSFLYNIVNFGLDKVQQSTHTFLCRLLNNKQVLMVLHSTKLHSKSFSNAPAYYLYFDSTTSNGSHRFPDKINIHFSCISKEKMFCEDFEANKQPKFKGLFGVSEFKKS